MEDETEYFKLFRDALKSANFDHFEAIKKSFGIALETLLKPDVNVHLRFLAAHVIWYSFYTVQRSSEFSSELKSIFQSGVPSTTYSIVQTLLSISEASSSQDPLSNLDNFHLPLSTADLSIFNGYINGTSNYSSSFIRFILPLIFRSLDEVRKSTVLDPYQHLYVLNNGLQKLVKIPVDKRNFSNAELLELLENVETKIVRPYWDSRFSGCADLAIDGYKAILDVLGPSAGNIGDLILQYADNNRYPWYLRGKYRFLCVLVASVDITQLLSCERHLLDNLNAGLAATHVAPFCAAVYKTVLNILTQKLGGDIGKHEPLQRWVVAVVDLLVSENRLLALHASRHWVPVISKFVPDGCQWLLDVLSQKREEVLNKISGPDIIDYKIVDSLCNVDLSLKDDETFHQQYENPNKLTWLLWASVLIRRHGQRKLSPMDGSELNVCLYHLDDEIRLETFMLILDISGKFAPLSKREYACTHGFLLTNLTVTNTSFRRRLLATYFKWFNQTVDFFSKSLTSTLRHPLLDDFKFFVKKILKTLCDELFIGANYQRLTTTLALLHTTLDCLFEKQHVWHTLEIDEEINSNCEFASRILRCLQNSSEEIRRQAVYLLTKYFKYPFRSPVLDTDRIAELFSTAAVLCSSPKAIDCETGSIIWDLIVRILVLEENIEIRLNQNDQLVKMPEFDRCNDHFGERWSNENLLTDILAIMQSHFRNLQADLRTAAADTPLHGWCLALTTILSKLRGKAISFGSTLSSLRVQLLDMACQVIDFMLNALGSPAEGLCPSLAEMQDAIVSSVSDEYGDGTGNDMGDDPTIPLDQQLVLACCWLNIKAFAMLLEELAQFAILYDDNPEEITRRIGLALFDAMSRTRHFGALEGCEVAFYKYLRICMSSENSDIRDIPMELLHKILDHVAKPKRVSITRRSVGFPIMIESLVTAGWSLKKRDYLETAFQKLLSISESSNTCLSDQDEKSDVDVVRAMHCLRLLIRSSPLYQGVLPYVSACYRLAVQHFSSPVWSIRNSAMLLLSAVLWRLFGRREVKQDDDESSYGENRMDLVEFCADFMDVWRFFCDTLARMASEGLTRDIGVRLFALLTFAQNLIITDLCGWPELARDATVVISTLIGLLRIPDLRLKRLVTEILANFLPDVDGIRWKCFMAIKEFMENDGTKLALNDHMALNYLASALKLGKDKADRDDQKTMPSKTTIKEDPVSICQWLKKLILYPRKRITEHGYTVLARCVSGNYGRSAQCLALPIYLVTFVQERTEMCFGFNSAEENMTKVMKEVIEFSDQCQNETKRLASAYSLACVRRLMKNEDNEKSMVDLLETLKSDIFFAFCSLLTDEDARVRYAAACSFFDHINVGFGGSVMCLYDLFDEIVKSLPSVASQTFIRKLLQIESDSLNIEHLFSIIHQSTEHHNQDNFLFNQQDFNTYREEYSYLRLLDERLRNRMAKESLKDASKWFDYAPEPPKRLTDLIAEAKMKLKNDFRFRRRYEEMIFLMETRLEIRNHLIAPIPEGTSNE